MRVEVEPRNATIVPGQPTLLTVRVVNTGVVISGHRIRMLGADPRWVTIDQEQLSLFPDAAGVVVLTVTLPPGIPAGLRRVSVEVQELTPPNERSVIDVELTVPAELGVKVQLDPVSVTGGKRVTLGVTVDNVGNSPVDVDLAGTDEEAQVNFAFKPPGAMLGPGERTLATVILKAKRPFWGSPKIRPFKVNVGPAQPPVSAFGTWIQKPLLTRGTIALIGLVLAITVFAVILTVSLSRVVGQSTADRNLALQVAQGTSGSGAAGSSAISGTVALLTSNMGVSGVTVEVFIASDSANPLASVATGAGGTYTFQGLAAGSYKVRFSGAGFTQLWYPASLTPDNATPVPLSAGQKVAGVNVVLGGVPATLSGTVTGSSPGGATVTLEALISTPTAAATATTPSTTTNSAAATAPPGTTPAVVTSVTVDATGAFTLAQIPSPSTYDLVVAKTGFATVTQEVDLGSGEQRTGIVITLVQGNGSISGQVNGPNGPLGGATVSATNGQTTVNSVTLSQATAGAAAGSFIVTNLPTPATLTVTFSAPGFASQTLNLSLASGQQLTGVSVTLASGSGSISGVVSVSGPGSPGGVTVSVTNGQLTLQTVTLSTGTPGKYTVSGLPLPGSYSVTFSRPDLVSQTYQVTLNNTPGSTPPMINPAMVSATASLTGVVTAIASSCLPDVSFAPVPTTLPPSTTVPLDTTTAPTVATTTVPPTTTTTLTTVPPAPTPITVTLSSATTTYSVIAATSTTAGPNGPIPAGTYTFDSVAPGTYTLSFSRQGGQPTTFIETLSAGQNATFSPPALAAAASICGVLYQTTGPALPGKTPTAPSSNQAAQVEVQLFPANQYPGGQSQQVLSGANGSFEFDNVNAPQAYIVQFDFPQGSAGQFTIQVDAAASKASVICAPAMQPSSQYCLVNTNAGGAG